MKCKCPVNVLKLTVMFFCVVLSMMASSLKAQTDNAGAEQTRKVFLPIIQSTVSLTYEQLMTQYDLQPVNSVPEGIEPIRVGSPQELAVLMADLDTITPSEELTEDELAQAAAFNSPSCQAMSTGLAKLRVHADIEIQNGYITKRYGIRPSFTGTTFGLSMSDGWGYFTQFSGKSVSWTGGATIHTYILLSTDLTTIRSTPFRCSGSFRAP